jgi:hypothetical protein
MFNDNVHCAATSTSFIVHVPVDIYISLTMLYSRPLPHVAKDYALSADERKLAQGLIDVGAYRQRLRAEIRRFRCTPATRIDGNSRHIPGGEEDGAGEGWGGTELTAETRRHRRPCLCVSVVAVDASAYNAANNRENSWQLRQLQIHARYSKTRQ